MSRLGNIARTFVRQTANPARTPSGDSDTEFGAQGQVVYSPDLDGQPDPGEVVWAWVSFEDDPSQGKDRPVLLIGRQGETLLGLQLSSKDHDRDAADEVRHGRYWVDIGAGDWDSQRRPSEVRLDRLLAMEELEVRREGAVLHKDVFETVVRAAAGYHDLT